MSYRYSFLINFNILYVIIGIAILNTNTPSTRFSIVCQRCVINSRKTSDYYEAAHQNKVNFIYIIIAYGVKLKIVS